MRGLTKANKERGNKLKELGCIVCHEFLYVHTEPEIHHLDGKVKCGCHDKTIGLCPNHHRFKSNTGEWHSRHGDGKYSFEKAYGPERELLARTNELMNEN